MNAFAGAITMTTPLPIGLMNFVNPSTVVEQLSVPPGAQVADFGCGAGYFSFEFAKAAGSDGRVYALDVLPSALEAVASKAKMLGLGNVVPQRVNLERENGSGMGTNSLDWVVIKDMLFQNEHKEIIIREALRVLHPGGCVLFMEWSPSSGGIGPSPRLRISPDILKEMVIAAGFSVDRDVDAGAFHYSFVARKGEQ